jgi:release factor glutamine methyltransferase
MPEAIAPMRAVLQRAVDRLKGHGVPDCRRQVFSIWSGISGDRWSAVLEQDTVPAAAIRDRFEHAVDRLARGEPLAYVTGTIGFRHLTLQTDRRALIPRPETEGLIDLLLQRVHAGVVADVGTGTGCLALSLAMEGGFNQVLAIDNSQAALDLAAQNVAATPTTSPVRLVQGDLCASIAHGTLDALVSNPPYLSADEYAALDRSVRDWEPAAALVAGVEGLEIVRRLLNEGRRTLRSGGWLALEVDCSRADRAAQHAGYSGWENVSIHQDLFGRERYLLAQRSESL